MYSMKRTMVPVPRKRSTRSSAVWSFLPRSMTALILIGSKPAPRAASIPREHGREVAAAAVHLLEDLLVEAVEAHREALQACGLELGRVLGEPRAVGRERDVLDTLEARERGDDLDDVAPQQRLAAGEPDLLDAELREQARDALDLAGREPVRARQELVMLAVELGRHAVRAAEVAAIDHGNPQIAERPAQPVLHGRLRLPVCYGVRHRVVSERAVKSAREVAGSWPTAKPNRKAL